ncbi:MAG TPA: hypothetical protein VF476_15000, partial [Chitinophagaceae bacterium]
MTKTSTRMNRHRIALLFLAAVTGITASSCNKNEIDIPVNSNQVSGFSSEVLDKWMTLQLRLMRNATGIPNQAFSRPYVYAAITALESLAPGLPAHSAWSSRWNGLTGLPVADHSVHYYYPANLNASLAGINKAFFPNANNADKAAIDSLENALKQEFLSKTSSSVIDASSQFGKAVATAVFN